MKKELSDIKNELMKKELEDIKRERMRQELEEIKAEREPHPAKEAPYVPPVRRLSISTVIMAAFTLLVAGYLIGTLFYFDVAGTLDKLLVGFSLPVTGYVTVVVASALIALIGMGLIVMARK